MDLKRARHRCHDTLQFLLRIPKSLNDVADKRAVLNLMRWVLACCACGKHGKDDQGIIFVVQAHIVLPEGSA
jgi:hypothetical protein